MLMLSSRRARESLGRDCQLSDEEIGALVERFYGLANVVVDGFKASPKSVRDTFQPHGVKLFEKNAAPPSGSGMPAVSPATTPPEPEYYPSTADEPMDDIPMSQRCEGVQTLGDVEKWVAEENQRGLCRGESDNFHRPNPTSYPE